MEVDDLPIGEPHVPGYYHRLMTVGPVAHGSTAGPSPQGAPHP
ncbi:hypothetical protein [Streptomyces sp. C36]